MSENMTPLKKPTWRDRLHDWKTAVQRHLVIGKHKLHKKRQASAKASVRWLRTRPFYHHVGHALYDLGFQAEYLVVRTGRGIRFAAFQLVRGCVYVAKKLKRIACRLGTMLWNEILCTPVVFVRGIWRIARNAVWVAKTYGVWRALKQAGANLRHGVELYGKLVPRTMAYVVPVVAAMLCWGFVEDQLAQSYVLAVQVKGQNVGFVASENVFESAKDSVNERINYAATNHTGWDITPTYTVAAIEDKSELLNETTMADAILRTSEDEIRTGTALYIDGELRRVTTDGETLKDHIQQMKAPFDTGEENVTVGFNHEVELEDGIYFNDSFSDVDEVMNYLSSDEVKQELYTLVPGDSISLIASKNGLTQAELYELNPGLKQDSKLFPGDQLIVQKQETVLEIRVNKEITYTEEIPFSTKTTTSENYDFGTVKTLVEGQPGEEKITALQTYDADGNILHTEILSTQILREPVTKEVVKGTRLKSGSIGKVGNGTLMWPVPSYRYCARWATGRHRGVDINGPVGTPIYSADSGVVVKAGMNRAGAGSNYGLSMIIDHGNGIKTVYAHCSALYVSAGQSVSQGQHIANIGMTGRTTGPHLHFEIRNSSGIVPPQSVFHGK